MMTTLMHLSNMRGSRAANYEKTRNQFHDYLSRPTDATAVVSLLQKRINAVPKDMRYHDDVKRELHQRLDDSLQELHSSIEERETMTRIDLKEMENDGYVEENVEMVVGCYLSLMQAEVDRHHETRRVLTDAMVAAQRTVALPQNEEEGRMPVAPPVLDDIMFGAENGEGEGRRKQEQHSYEI